MIRAVIFDMDGTMVNTEDLWKEVNSELAEKYGVIFEDNIRTKMMGRKEEDALKIFRDFYGLPVSVNELLLARKQMLFEKIDKVAINPGLIELIGLLEKLNIKKAIATSTYKDFAYAVIKAINVGENFPVVITGDTVVKGKPNPDIFIKAANTLGVEPQNCLVLEDAQNGVEAGYNAGMMVLAIPHKHSLNQDFSKANKVLNSLKEIDEAMINSL
jgi:beta-phosphoglucomutase